jgi:hypothetical protein
MDVYAQLLDRSKRGHGAAFDALLDAAQRTLYGAMNDGFSPPPAFSPSAAPDADPENSLFAADSDDGRTWVRTRDLSRVKRALSH